MRSLSCCTCLLQVVFGKEYFYSGGIQSLPPDGFSRLYMPPCEVLTLGETEVPEELFAEFLETIAEDFTAAKYSLMKHNCNHFTEACAQVLLGSSIPESIRSVPDKVMATPMGAAFSQMFEGSANGFDPLARGVNGGGAAGGLDVMAALGQALPPQQQTEHPLAPAAVATGTSYSSSAGLFSPPPSKPHGRFNDRRSL